MKKKGSESKRKQNKDANAPIGVFDSGLGGLTVVRALRRELPFEEIVYLGDLAHLPYGTKSDEEIKHLSLSCADFLLQKKIKALVIACNSASSVSAKTLAKKLSIPVLNVISPAVDAAIQISKNKKIGVIATNATIESGSYSKQIEEKCPAVQCFLKACPLFVSLAEEGWLNDHVSVEIAHKYLNPLKQKNIDTLILGCTHYPLLSKPIAKVMGRGVSLVDSAKPTAIQLKNKLTELGLLAARKSKADLRIFVTDFVRNFLRVGEIFLRESLEKIQKVKIV